MDIKIRNAIEDDLKDINDINNFYILNTNFNVSNYAKTMEERKQWFSEHNGKYPVIVAEKNNIILGFASLSKFRSADGYDITAEVTVYLKNDCLEKGIGTMLMKELIKQAENSFIKVLISVITAENTNSIKFHEKFGFETKAVFSDLAYKNGEYISVVYMIKKLFCNR